MSSIFYCLRLPPKFSMKWLLRGLTLPSLYMIIYYDNTVTYIWVAWSCDTKEIIAIPFEVIPMWIIEEYKIRRARSGFYFDVNEVICPRTSKFSSYNRYPGSLCRKELKMVMEAFRINIVISRLTESWCLTLSHSRRLCQVETQGIKSQATVLLTENDTWHFFSLTTVCIDCQQHAQPKHK